MGGDSPEMGGARADRRTRHTHTRNAVLNTELILIPSFPNTAIHCTCICACMYMYMYICTYPYINIRVGVRSVSTANFQTPIPIPAF